MKKGLLLSLALCLLTMSSFATDWYTRAAGAHNANDVNDWTVNATGGVGAAPADFNDNTDIWHIIDDMQLSGDWNVAGSIDIVSGTFDGGVRVISVGGDFTNIGTFAIGNSTVAFVGTGNQEIIGLPTTFYNFTNSNTSGEVRVNVDIAVFNLFTTAASTLTVMDGNQLLDISFTAAHSGVLSTSATDNPAIPAGKTWGGTIEFSAAGGGQFVPQGTYANLSFLNTSGTQTAVGAITASGTLTTTGGGTLNMGANQLLGAFTAANSGVLQTQNLTNPAIPTGQTWGGTVQFNATTGAQEFPEGTYNNLTFNNTSGTQTAQGAVTVNGTFITTAGGTVDMSTFQLLGTLTATNGGTLQTANTTNPAIPSGKTWTGTVQFNAAAGGQSAPLGTYTNLSFLNTSGTQTAVGAITASGTLTTTAGGTLDMGTNQLLGAFTAANSGVLQTQNTTSPAIPASKTWGGTVDFNATSGGQIAPLGTYNNLTFSNTSGSTSVAGAGTFTVNGNFTTTAGGTVDLLVTTFSGAAATIASNGTLRLQGPLPTGKTWGGLVEYYYEAAQVISAGTYNNLTSTANTGTRTFGGTVNVTNDMIITTSSGTVVTAAINVGGDFTVTFNGAGTVTLDGALDVDGDILLAQPSNPTANRFVPAGYQINVGGNWTLNSSSTSRIVSTATGATVVFDGTGPQSISTIGTVANNMFDVKNSNTSNTLSINCSMLTLDGSFTNDLDATVSTGANTIYLRTEWTNNGTFIPGTGLVWLAGPAGAHNMNGNLNFYNLSISVTGSNWIMNSAASVSNTFAISGGVTAPAGLLTLGGNVTKGGTGVFTHNSGTVELNGTGVQALPATAITFNNLHISNVTSTVNAGAATTVNGTLTVDAGGYLNMGTNQLLGTLTAANSGTIQTANTTNPAIPTGKIWGGLVMYSGVAQSIADGTYNDLYITGVTGAKTFTGAAAVTGTFSVNATTAVTSLGGTLTANNVVLTSTTNANILDVTASNYQMNVSGNWTQSSSAASNPFNPRAGTVVLNGTGAQVLSTSGGTSKPTFYGLTVNNTTTPLALASNIDVTNTLTVSTNATVNPAAATQINSGAAAGTITGGGTILVTRTAATADYANQYKFSVNTLSGMTVDYNAAGAQNVNTNTYGTLITSGSGTKTAQGHLTVNDALNVGASTILDMGAASRLISGTSPIYTNAGTIKTSVPTSTSATPIPAGITWGGTVEYGALTGAQTVMGGTYDNLTLSNTSGTNATGGSITANGTLNLGKIDLAANNLIVGAAATVSGASSTNYVITTGAGRMRKLMTSNGTYAYPVGDATHYTPVSVNITGAGYAGGAYTEAKVTDGKHPSNANVSNSHLTRYWSIATSGITTPSYNAAATYAGDDIVGTEGLISAATYAGSLPWTKYGAAGANTINATAVTTTATDVSGITSAIPSASVTPTTTTVCATVAQTLTASSDGDATVTYTWAPGTNLSATTGASVDATSTNTVAPSIDVYTVTVTDGNGFTNTVTATVSVNVIPTAVLADAAPNPVCNTENLTLTGAADYEDSYLWEGPNSYTSTMEDPAAFATSGLSAGIYTLSATNACGTTTMTTSVVTVTPTPSINGYRSVCLGGPTSPLTSDAPGGTWISSDPAKATIDFNTGVLTAVSTGTTRITYTNTSGCINSIEVTVGVMPVLGGTSLVCANNTVTLTNDIPGGTWTSRDFALAIINASTGVVTGISAGDVNMLYTTTAGCFDSVEVDVDPAVNLITGEFGVCFGYSTTLHNATPGGTWSSSNPTIAPIDVNTGEVSGLIVGLVDITYRVSPGCWKTSPYNVKPLPNVITGATTVCAASNTTLANSSGGGTWTSSTPASATVFYASGVVSGVAAGTTLITYNWHNGCYVTHEVSVHALPAVIGGTTTICAGSTSLLTSSPGGGTWASSHTSTATIGSSSGLATAVVGGLTTITYTLATGCRRTTAVTVSNLTPAISGALLMCPGGTNTLTSGAGHIWSSADPTIASVSASGVVTGVDEGEVDIIYTHSVTGCPRAVEVTVNALPNAITGPLTVCIGATAALANVSPSGTWASSDWTNATVNMSTGVVTPVSTGTSTITYKVAGSGCYSITEVTVNATLASITGTTTVCVGSNTTLAHGVGGGVWSSSDITKATIDASTGEVTGISPATVTITYTVSGGCYKTVALTVKAVPVAITGTTTVCVGTTTALANATTGGTWASSTPAQASIGVSTGIVSGVAPGNPTITYRTAGAGCFVTQALTVNAALAGIGGTAVVCAGGGTATLTHVDGTGAWTSANPARATIHTSTGLVTGVSAGTVIMSYTIANGCYQQKIVTVNAVPVVSGATDICVGGFTTMSSTMGGGAWTSSNPAQATINSTSRLVGGVSTGTTIITHTVAGCSDTQEITVNPVPAPITGILTTCIGGTTTLDNVTGSGTWESGNGVVATIDGMSGVATGTGSGTSIISYTLSTGCRSTAVLTVDNIPAAITGILDVCSGSTTELASATPGGVWSSASPAIGTISASGVVTAIGAGQTIISYVYSPSCYQTATVTVNAAAAANTGDAVVCAGQTTPLFNATMGGTWTSGNTARATIGSSSGVVTGVSAGTVNVTYSVGTSCYSITEVTVNAALPTIGGTVNACVGEVSVLTNAVMGGTWSSSDPTKATVDLNSGAVTAVLAGTTTITYITSAACVKTTTFTSKALPAGITGTASVCEGATTALANASSGGTWTSNVPATASVFYSSGVVTGVADGMTTITYNWYNGCIATREVTVNDLPAAITGTTTICAGNTSLLSSGGGGTWTSSHTSTATIGSSSGLVTAVTGGLTTISYTISTGCMRTATVTVGNMPAAISGSLLLCPGGTSTLTSSAGHVWSSANPLIATVSASGVVTGIDDGTVNILYTHSVTGCPRTVAVTVNELPAVITGPSTICLGSAGTMANATPGGTWASSDWTNAIIDMNAGDITAVSTGTSNITYKMAGNGCHRTTQVTVNATLAAITGTKVVCVGATTTLNNVVAGGTWVSSTPAKGSVDLSTGVVAGIDPGTTTILYTASAACYTSAVVTVNALPAAITGTTTVCQGTTTALANATPGGTWSSSNTGFATIGSTSGIATGVGAGVPEITYRVNGAGCFVTQPVTVNAALAAIGGTATVCVNGVTTLTHGEIGGTWTSGNIARATVGSLSGEVTGVSAGTVTISYSVAGGCYQQKIVTVNPLPLAITGVASVCVSGNTTLGSSTGGGTWTSSVPTNAIINTATRIVSGLVAGTTMISYTLATGCAVTREVTVNPIPAVITGTLTTCIGGTTTLANMTGGGDWTSGTPAKASVDISTGVVTGASNGTSSISYTLSTGCRRTAIVTVANVPTPLTGTLTLCQGSTTTLASGPSGGAWATSDGSKATVVAGVVTGVGAGEAVISYIYSAACYQTATVTVNAALSANTGLDVLCTGQTTTLLNVTGGGTWSSSNTAKATVNVSTGVVTGVSAGTSNITYRTTGGCFSVTEVTVNAALATITGTANACIAETSTLEHAEPGGTWSSSNTAKALVGSLTGVVTAVSAGTSTITYMISAGCYKTAVFTAKGLPNAITGTATVCEGSNTTLTNSSGGGTWSSSAPLTGSVYYSSGVVAGILAGNTTITYNWYNGCNMTREVTVNPRPSTFSGATTICAGTTSLLGSTPNTGTWTSSMVSTATIGSSTGMVTAVTGGNTVISYTLPTGCRRTTLFTVNNPPAAITGIKLLCPGGTTTLASTAGHVWSSGDEDIATVSGSGMVTGVADGLVNIIYTHSVTGCPRTTQVTVNPLPASILGTSTICVGSAATLTNVTPSGTWASSVWAKATINTSTGLITGVAAGTTNVTYKVTGNGCHATTQVTVNAAPAAITGTLNVCIGATTDLNHVAGGGAWTSSNGALGTVDGSTGLVTGISAGTPTITYTISTGCYKTANVTVKALPLTISGASTVAVGANTTLSNGTGGGTWSSSNGNAFIASSTGIVTGLMAGATTITYKVTSTQCYRTHALTVTASKPGATTTILEESDAAFTLYPNPTSGSFTINSSATGMFTVYSLDGKQVQQYSISRADITLSLPYDLAAGIYIGQFIGDDGSSKMVRLLYKP